MALPAPQALQDLQALLVQAARQAQRVTLAQMEHLAPLARLARDLWDLQARQVALARQAPIAWVLQARLVRLAQRERLQLPPVPPDQLVQQECRVLVDLRGQLGLLGRQVSPAPLVPPDQLVQQAQRDQQAFKARGDQLDPLVPRLQSPVPLDQQDSLV